MPLTTGARLGPYEIVAPLGAGGMGEVYKARDTRLDRSVAIKVLAPEIAGDPDLRARFEREARAVAALDHPHICGIYDVGEANGTHFIVMPHLDGQTLAARLEKGPLPLDQTLKIATEIADALDKAHRQGIIHRDLKPANIMLTKAGSKLLDFGLAKLKAPAGPISMSGMTRLATSTPFGTAQGGPGTAQGTILGTLHYMAPEQVEGKEADARSDIWALGTVIYEMATGTRPFKGDTPASVIGAILKDDPPSISSLQPLTPLLLDRIVSVCLAKDPEDRWQSARDLTRELHWTAERATLAPGAAGNKPSGRKLILALVAAVVLLVAMMPTLLRQLRETSVQPKTIRFSVLPPEKTTFTATNASVPSTQLAVSPDGQSLAFIASVAGRRPTLWIRTLDELSAREIAGTEDASYPFWSPDSRFVAFFAKNKLNKVAVAGGAPQKLCDAGAGRGGTWNRDDVIVFAPLSAGVLMRVSATGGTPVAVTALSVERQDTAHRFPWFLPDGRHFLLFARSQQAENRGVSVGSLDSSETTHLLTTNVRAVYDSAGFLIFATQGILMAQAFDTQRLALSGDPFQIARHVGSSTTDYAPFGVSDNGVLTYAGGTAAETGELRWFDRTGKALGTVGSPGDYVSIGLSPDQQRLAVSLVDPQLNRPDLWLMDLSRGTTSRFTADSWTDAEAIWSPDGNRIVFRSDRGGTNDIYIKPSSAGEAEERLFGSSFPTHPTDWSSDGKFVIFHTIGTSSGDDLWTIATSDRTPKLFLGTPFNEMQGHLSPDGRWMAYTSDESGALEVHVQAFPSGGQKSVISTGGGSGPLWRRDGRELFYLAADRKIMAVPVEAGLTFRAGAPNPLFEARVGTINPEYRNHYTVTADGQRFLVNTIQEGSGLSPITVVLNWTAALRK